MKKLFTLLILFSMFSLSFASWQGNVGLAIFASFGILIILYMLAMGFGLDKLKLTTKEEMMQLLITAAIASALVGIGSFSDSFGTSLVAYQGGSGNMQEYALTDVLQDKIIVNLEDSYEKITNFAESAIHDSSKSHVCTFLSTSFFISSCNSYSTVIPPTSLALNAMAVAFVEIQALYLLTDLGYNYAFAVFLPFGLFLRTLKATRGAGAFLMALGFTLYFMLPLTIIFLDDLDEFYQNNGDYPSTAALSMTGCDPTITGGGGGWIFMDNPDNVKAGLSNLFQNNVDSYIYQIFVRVNVTLFVSAFVMAVSIRRLTSIFGSEVDVSAISRFM